MADTLPPDRHRSAGKQRGDTSGNVADPRYARSFQPDATGERPSQGRGAPRCRTGDIGHDRHRPGRRDGDARSRRGGPAERAPRANPAAPGPAGAPARGALRGEAYAALDLGTNNCRLLIARPSGRDFTVIDAFSRVVKLGEGLATTGRLSDAAMDRALSALAICADKLRRRNVRLARSVATEACRRAVNGAEFIERVRRETGIALDVISAEEEARLAVLGCHILLEAGEGPAMIFDIGGGSTELVLLEAGDAAGRRVPRILDWQSVPWGVVSLTDTVGHDEGIEGEAGRAGRLERYARMRELVADSFAGFAARIGDAPRADDIRLLGTSGTVTTLASLHLELPQYDRKAVDGLIVCSDDMRAISARLSGMSPAERCNLPCIGNDRADLVVAGCAILETILDLWPAARLGVADRGIREGILRSMMAADRQGERALRKLRGERPER
ncbi:Ppx/GppA phosphatase family protein [Erythrobacter sp. HL-111]|uniref:Ppx/GppA phosphatase family protein n=1 Tax=Erythrobacter sp. HL-111 TaxID=1798193 RepID=UPI0006DB5BD3|nr:Ppx/GppA phosphatase family protein [Erythrobacter sp. HL-111]KPP89459.1 MAG: exopolyphosphatase / guanosine-5'-triphosphate,3'-diphosphate pyrophosphatase [Erythrobacteraceae bacterium HL-111]SDS48732.1 exopolyphosphatase / guanosine-5'-triphosphate,3'-diphosphate pyrophosphatase [Erythrobacter sp. HL-111]